MFTEDLNAFFSVDEHAVNCQVDGIEVPGIFNPDYGAVETRHGEIDGYLPVVTVKSSDVADIAGAGRSRVTIDGYAQEFIVRQVRPDRRGVTELILTETDASWDSGGAGVGVTGDETAGW